MVLFCNKRGHIDREDPNYIVVTPIELSETDLCSLGEKHKKEVVEEYWEQRAGSSGGYVYSDTDSKASLFVASFLKSMMVSEVIYDST